MSFWRHLKKLFQGQEQAEMRCSGQAEQVSAQPILHEVLERSEEEQALYEAWLSADGQKSMLAWLTDMHGQFLGNPMFRAKPICFLAIPSVNGFVINYSPQRWDADDFVCFFDHLKEQVLTLGYWTQNADIRVQSCGKVLETVQRYYLKPPRKRDFLSKEPQEQLYGNVLISLTLHNEQLINLKFSATHYTDRAYKEPRPFNELMQKICS